MDIDGTHVYWTGQASAPTGDTGAIQPPQLLRQSLTTGKIEVFSLGYSGVDGLVGIDSWSAYPRLSNGLGLLRVEKR